MEEYAAQQTAEKDARIAELEAGYVKYQGIASDRAKDIKTKDARIKELEEHASTMYEKMNGKIIHQKEELEAVKKDKDYLFKRLEETKDERDEAVKLLQDERSVIEGKQFEEWNIDRLEFLSCLSSGETKPLVTPDLQDFWERHSRLYPEGMFIPEDILVMEKKDFILFAHINPSNTSSSSQEPLPDINNPVYLQKMLKLEMKDSKELSDEASTWISVEVTEKLPEIGEYVQVNIWKDTVLKGRRVLNGWTAFFSDGEKLVDEHRPVTHHMPLPVPPESLTDKTI